MRIICLLLIFIYSYQKQLKIAFNHSTNLIQAYTSKGTQIFLKITFQSPSLLLDESLKEEAIFLEKNNNKTKLLVNEFAKFEKKTKHGLIQDDYLGTVGLQENSSFFQMLKKSFKMTQLKLQFHHKQNQIILLNQSCHYPLFAPLQITLSQLTTHTYTIDSFSQNFFPDFSFLKLIGKDKNPFQVNSNEINNEITISVRDRIISIPFRQLFTCGKYANSNSYECQIKIKDKPQLGGLLMYFDPILCSSGIQLHKSIDESWGFHYSHIVLLILQFFVLFLLTKEEYVTQIASKIFGAKKLH